MALGLPRPRGNLLTRFLDHLGELPATDAGQWGQYFGEAGKGFDPRTTEGAVSLASLMVPGRAGLANRAGMQGATLRDIPGLVGKVPEGPLPVDMAATARGYGGLMPTRLETLLEHAQARDRAAGYGQNVSWQQGGKPPPNIKGALEGLLEKIRPTQGKQMKIWDDEDDIVGPNWWEDDSPFGRSGYGQAGQSPLEQDHPKLFRPIQNAIFNRESWVADAAHDVGGQRLPGVGPRADATQHLAEMGGRLGRVDNQQMRRVRDDLRSRRETGTDKMPPPPNPQTYSEGYYKGAELNARKKVADSLVRVSRGRRGGV